MGPAELGSLLFKFKHGSINNYKLKGVIMAKGLNIRIYRGVKISRGKKVVLHVTDDNDKKYHIRFSWAEWSKFATDLITPIIDKE